MYYSVKRFHKIFDFYVLTFDKQTYEYLSNLNEENLKLISIDQYDAYFKTSADKFSDKKQYYFSATPNICLFLLKEYPEIDILLYLDADVYVFSSLEPLYEEFGDSSIGVCSHRVNPMLNFIAKHYGKYNVGVNLFRNSKTGLSCLTNWKNECETWYKGKPGYPLSFFSDQIFLDSWDVKYNELKVIHNIGVNTCYWNAGNYKFGKIDGQYFVNNSPLMIFHFSSLIKETETMWNTNSIYGLVSISGTLLEIYNYYICRIESYGLNNIKREKLNRKESLKKKIFSFVMKAFVNQKVIIK